jgi:hypothetical protein
VESVRNLPAIQKAKSTPVDLESRFQKIVSYLADTNGKSTKLLHLLKTGSSVTFKKANYAPYLSKHESEPSCAATEL